VPVQPDYVLAQTEDELVLRNYEGRVFHYRNPGRQASPESPLKVLCPVGSSLQEATPI
jgi:hypothetical protein